MKFQHHYNRNDYPRKNEVNHQPSKTIPDQSMSVREIMNRYARGLPLGGERVPSYHEDELPDLDKLDISEKFDLLESNKQTIVRMQEDLQEQEKKRNRPNLTPPSPPLPPPAEPEQPKEVQK